MKITALILVALGIASCREKPVDRFVEIGGKKQHILERGEGTPVVVFLTGMNCPLEHFYTVQSQVSKETKTFSYDRAGLGLSEVIDSVRTLDKLVSELNSILTIENIKGPYILVAHSYGGDIAKQFYNQFPEKVAGFVFVDCANDEVFMDSLVQKKFIPEDFVGTDTLASIGEQYEMKYVVQNTFSFKEKFRTELPVRLLIANGKRTGLTDEIIAIKVNTYKEFNKGSSHTKIIFTENSSHHIQRDEPELVTKAVKEIIAEAMQSYKPSPS